MAGRAEFVAYPGSCLDHWYIHRLGQSQDCELRGLAERNRTRQLNGDPGNGRVGGVHFVVKGKGDWWNARGGLPFHMVHSGQLGDAEKIR
jgi:hypothetical protein